MTQDKIVNGRRQAIGHLAVCSSFEYRISFLAGLVTEDFTTARFLAAGIIQFYGDHAIGIALIGLADRYMGKAIGGDYICGRQGSRQRIGGIIGKQDVRPGADSARWHSVRTHGTTLQIAEVPNVVSRCIPEDPLQRWLSTPRDRRTSREDYIERLSPAVILEPNQTKVPGKNISVGNPIHC